MNRPKWNGIDLHQTWPGKKWWHKPGPWCRMKARLGRRGAMLLLLGLTYIVIGYGEGTRNSARIPGAFHLDLDPLARGILWGVTGAVAVLFAFARHKPRTQPAPPWWRTDTVGWVSLYLIPTLYIVSFGLSWMLWLTGPHPPPFPPVGDATAWYNAALRVPFILIVLICSGWLENPRREHCR